MPCRSSRASCLVGKPSAKIRNSLRLRVFNRGSPIAPIQGGFMSHRPLVFLAAVLFAAGAGTATRAQSNPSSSSGETSQAAVQTTAATSATATPAEPAGKKVWTNDDVGDLRGESVISTVGQPAVRTAAKPAANAKNGNAKSYEAQIARLEAQIPPLDAQIAELQAAIDGKPTGDGKESQRPRSVKTDSWSVEMQDLQKKRDDTLDHIAALKDQARHQGVAPNTLP